jgi:hypothetical protein
MLFKKSRIVEEFKMLKEDISGRVYMRKKINIWSFILSFICIGLLFVIPQENLITKTTGIHKLSIILYFTLITLILGLIGFSGVNGWKSMLRSTITTFVTLFLSVFLIFVLFFGKLLS